MAGRDGRNQYAGASAARPNYRHRKSRAVYELRGAHDPSDRRRQRHDQRFGGGGWVRYLRWQRGSRGPTPFERVIDAEFCRIRPSVAIFVPNEPAASIAYNGIPYATEQGISKRVSGKIFQQTGNRYVAHRKLPLRDRR